MQEMIDQEMISNFDKRQEKKLLQYIHDFEEMYTNVTQI